MKTLPSFRASLRPLLLTAAILVAFTAAWSKDPDPALSPGQKITTTTPENCVIEKFTVHSDSMNREIRAAIVLPPEYAQKPDARYPVLYALHGSDAPYDAWAEMIPLRRTLVAHPMLLVCFDGDPEGWYIDATKKPGSLFATFFFKELIPYIDSHYRTRPDGASRGVTGFSMGGYGAFQYMLMHPEMFASVSCLSGVFGMFGETGDPVEESIPPLLGPIEQNKAVYLKYGIYNRMEEAFAKGIKLPPMYIRVGTEDAYVSESYAMSNFLFEQNKNLSKQGKPTQVFYYSEGPGKHLWPFWRDSSDLIADFHWRSFQPPFKPATAPAGAAASPSATATPSPMPSTKPSPVP